MAGKEKIIELKNITKTYENGFTAVSDFNLYVNKGEFVTFLGPSGCGKTTTLRMIAGFELPTSGEILLNGKDIAYGGADSPERQGHHKTASLSETY